MKTEFRNRAFLPVVLPIAIVLGIGALVALFALILLYNTHLAALVIAAVAAAGILFAISLAASKDELSGGEKAAVFAAGVLPILAGAIFSIFSATGGVDASLLNINREPHLQVPEDAVIAATSDQSFCLPVSEDECEDTNEWSVATQGEDRFVFDFDNRDEGIPHNVSIATLTEEDVAPEEASTDVQGERLFAGDVFQGPERRTYESEEGLEPGRYFFVCDVHSTTMTGILTVTEEGEAGEDDGGGEAGGGEAGGGEDGNDGGGDA